MGFRGVVVAVAVTLVVCASDATGGAGVVHGDALTLGGDRGLLCIPVGGTTEVTYGFEGFENESDDDIVIGSVSVRSPTGVTAAGAFVAAIDPAAGVGAVGAMPNWPLTDDQTRDIPRWNLVPAAGSTIPALDGTGRRYNIVLHLRVTGSLPAGFDAVTVEYARNGRIYVQDGSTAFRIERDAC